MDAINSIREVIEDMLVSLGYVYFHTETWQVDNSDFAVLLHPRDMSRLKDELLTDSPSISYYPLRGLVTYRGVNIQESFICAQGVPKLIKIL